MPPAPLQDISRPNGSSNRFQQLPTCRDVMQSNVCQGAKRSKQGSSQSTRYCRPGRRAGGRGSRRTASGACCAVARLTLLYFGCNNTEIISNQAQRKNLQETTNNTSTRTAKRVSTQLPQTKQAPCRNPEKASRNPEKASRKSIFL